MPVLEQVLEKNSPHVKVVFKQFPLKMHKAAAKAAAVALVANRHGKFWELHNLMFENYRKLNNEEITNMAEQLGFESATFQKDMKDVNVLKNIQKDIKEGLGAGVRGVPKVYINGRPLKKRTLQGFQALIDLEMNKLSTGTSKVKKEIDKHAD